MSLTSQIEMPRWLGLLLCGLGVYLWYLVFVKGWPIFGHWLAHKLNWEIGEHITWRRAADNVLMVGRRCRICGKVTCIHPSRPSYRRMMRGQKWF